MYDLFIEILGWIGSIMLIAAYFLNSKDVWNAQSISYQMTNVIGSIFLALNCFHNAAYPSGAVNIIWLFIGLVYLYKLNKKTETVISNE